MSRDDPTNDFTLAPTRPEWIDRACDQFEAAWGAGERPRIERSLAVAAAGVGGDPAAREALLRALLLAERDLLRRDGLRPDVGDYLERFPDDHALVRSVMGPVSAATESADLRPGVEPGRGEAETDADPDATPRDRGVSTEPDPGLQPTLAWHRPPAPAPASGPGTETEVDPRPPDAGPAPGPAAAPGRVGRYLILRKIGEGGFGLVYLAKDEVLGRLVAVKVPRAGRLTTARDVAEFLAEAQTAAGLRHAGVVSVFDIGTLDSGVPYVVQEYINGETLAEVLASERGNFDRLVGLLLRVAVAVHHAHKQGFVHRDLKPSNILVDRDGSPYVADFGLALNEDGLRGRPGEVAGTPAYMSPEQVRGESHRLDGRTDVWALGVILYQMLTGREPFSGGRARVFDEILYREPKPPRQIDDKVPKELERVCLKALSKRANERHTTARDLADDLDCYLKVGPLSQAPADPRSTERGVSGPSSSGAPWPSDRDLRGVAVVPRGLRSFDGNDADFFLNLLPGPRDRDGLPESLRFWKRRVEEPDAGRTFSVGLIYGPSGCGKSSLVKAGLLPRLAGNVTPVYVEAGAGETEARLLKGLKAHCEGLPPGLGLADTVAGLRRGLYAPPGRKFLLVIDQFEQWLHARRDDPGVALVDALRQCDGGHVQAIVLVRDDFWLAAGRFMKELEVRLIEGENSAMVELFDARHARRVLTLIGQAYATFPAPPGALSRDQEAFLDQAVSGLARDGRVVPVRLTLFAEMVKRKPWVPATLRAVGGAEGVGMAFLEETFSAPTAPPEHRYHRKAAQAVLKALLPEAGTPIKGRMRSRRELTEASGYAQRPEEFDDLIRVLDTELRLITPTDPDPVPDGEGGGAGTPAPASGGRYYQLTHDYIVNPLQDWLTRKQRETRKGRAEIRLAELAAIWGARPENRYLPSLWEWAEIRLSTRPRDWAEPQRKMMAQAARVYPARMALWAVLLAATAAAAGAAYLRAERLRRQNEVRSLVSQLLVAEWDRLPGILARLDRHREPWRGEVARIAASPGPDGLRARVALARLGRDEAASLLPDLPAMDPRQLRTACERLAPWKDRLAPRLWSTLNDPGSAPELRRRVACVLARLDPGNPGWTAAGPEAVASLLDEQDPLLLTGWLDLLRPVGGSLVDPLAAACADRGQAASRVLIAASALAELGSDRPDLLDPLLLDADDRAHAVLFHAAGRDRARLAASMLAALRDGRPADPEDDPRGARRRVNAALTLARLGRWDAVWPLLRSSESPGLRTLLVHKFQAYGVPASGLLGVLKGAGAGAGAGASEASVRQAALLALGGYAADRLPASERDPVIAACRDLYTTDPDAGVHAGAEWLLTTWGLADEVAALRRSLESKPGAGNWYVNGQGQTMVVVPGPARFAMGSPETEADRDAIEPLHQRLIPRSFAVSSHEVTVAQFLRFRKGFGYNAAIARGADGPVNNVTWYEAVAYCRWLTDREGLPESEQCYPEGTGPRTTFPADFFSRTGYRLLTEAEWEYACRAGTITRWFFGGDESMLTSYAWFTRNCQGYLWPVGLLKPNPWGLFDVYGNCLEWCQSPGEKVTPTMAAGVVVDDRADGEVDEDGKPPHRVLRGGAYRYFSRESRSAKRYEMAPESRMSFVGLRVARTVRVGPPKTADAGDATPIP